LLPDSLRGEEEKKGTLRHVVIKKEDDPRKSSFPVEMGSQLPLHVASLDNPKVAKLEGKAEKKEKNGSTRAKKTWLHQEEPCIYFLAVLTLLLRADIAGDRKGKSANPV